MMMLSAVNMAKGIVKQVVADGDIVVDATVGNGKDTIFLAGLVGSRGKVYGFDVQKTALDIAKDVLQIKGLLDRAELICDGHQNIDRYISTPVKAVMFNLGYLPGGDRSIVTCTDTTLTAVHKCLSMLMPGGVVTIAAYCGHPGGRQEKDALTEMLSGLDASVYKCLSYQSLNQKNHPPVLMVAGKAMHSK